MRGTSASAKSEKTVCCLKQSHCTCTINLLCRLFIKRGSSYIFTKGRVQKKKKYGNFHKGGGGQTRSAFFFCILNSSRNALKKNFLCGGGTPPKKYPKGPPFGYFGKIFHISKKSPKIKKSQGSPLWIFWEIFINLKKISNNGLLLKKNKILFSIL